MNYELLKNFLIVCLSMLISNLATAQIVIETTDVTNCKKSDGKVNISVNAMAQGFKFEYSVDGGSYQPSGSFENLAEGEHTATIRDKETKCSFSKKFGIGNISNEGPDALKLDIFGGGTTEFCNNSNPPTITLTASGSGGSGNFDYSWPNGTIDVRSSGQHFVTVTDKTTGCKRTGSAQIIIVPIVCSRDPNDIVGPVGFGPEKMIAKSKQQSYMIRFENDPDFATAPAQVVKINHPLDENVNPFSLRLGDFGFAGLTFTVPSDKTYYASRLDLVAELGIVVDVTAGIDAVKKEAFWIFESKDPATGLPPADASLGFLPVNDESAKGEGYVTYLVKAANPTVSGDLIHAKASIVFDANNSIETPEISNWIDAENPTSLLQSLPEITDSTEIELIWEGRDETKGSGVRNYSIYFSEDDSPFQLYQEGLTGNKVVFDGKRGSKYCFNVIATDNVGNVEPMKSICEAATTVSPLLPVTWLYFAGRQAPDGVRLDWGTVSEQGAESFVIQRSVNARVFSDIGTLPAAGNSSATINYHYTDADFASLNSKILYYRLKQIDFDGSVTYTSIIAVHIKTGAQEPAIAAYPNPFTQNITVEFMNVTATKESDHVALYSLDGKKFYSRKIKAITESTVLLQNLPRLVPGVYLLRTSIDGKMYTLKMFKE